MLENGDELFEVLDRIANLFQIVDGEIVQKPALQCVEIDAVIKVFGREHLRGGTVTGSWIVRGRQQRRYQGVDHGAIACRVAAFHDDDVILLSAELARVLAVQPPIFAVAPDQVVAAGFEFEMPRGVEGSRHGQQHARQHKCQRPPANQVSQPA